MSVLFLVGDRAYKLHKPVRFAFADFSDRADRQVDSHREVTLNRRLAPDVYLDVADVSVRGDVIDHLVVMRRMPTDRQLATLARTGDDIGPCLAQIARLLVGFHARAVRAPAIDDAARAPAIMAAWEANFLEVAPFVGSLLAEEDESRLQARVREFLSGRQLLFDDRIARGQVCDGHGDLQAEDIFCLADGPRILDCITFDDRLRYADVAADLAFLLMDLERIGAPWAATRLRADYEELSGHPLPSALLHHYIAARAYVRAKVHCLKWAQGDGDAVAAALRFHGIALDHLHQSRVRLVLVGGLPGTGKSTLADALADRIGADVLRSDDIRKERAGLPLDRPMPASYWSGLYEPRRTVATYETLLQRARSALGMGRTVILDASWTSQARREDAARIAGATNSQLIELRCVAPGEVTTARLAERRTASASSDATPAVAAAMASDEDLWPSATVIDTAGSFDASLAQAAERLSRD